MDYNLNYSHFPEELKLILNLMANENDQQQYDDIDWDLFLLLVKHHRVYPTIYSRLKRNRQGKVPTHVTQKLSYNFQQNTLKMLQLCAEMELLSKLFTENDICSLHLKGPVVASDLYGDISKRTCRDLDILVQMKDLDQVEKLLINQGYEKDDYIESVLNDWKWRHHHITFFHPQKKIKVEIHWRLNPGPSKDPSFDELWERKRCSSLTHFPVYFLGREDLFLFLITHGAREGWFRLRWLLDINQMVRGELDSEKLNILIKQYQYSHLVGQALVLARELLHTPIPEEFQSNISGEHPRKLAHQALFYIERIIELHINPLPEEVSAYHQRYLFNLKTNQQKLLFLCSFFYPYSTDAEILPLPKHLHFLYFPLRPFLWAWRKTRKHALP
ncbi:nucleotidyltransferase family protein [Ammoniphilus sp. YIM 78166]|uniref:nucleotidyltransferase domain-containing protein n=1 Tax=Ammoniphilus sp. YIM 78166 TaxID=1644106 RepID=UPI00106F0F4C|nr:nucleotidyltransferase family protein [Ammoniphilus sp. YIM 78166]